LRVAGKGRRPPRARPRVYAEPVLAALRRVWLIAKLVETGSGATLWSNSGDDERTVAGVSKFGSSFSFGADDPEHAYGDLARSLCRKVTRDFRHSWRHKCF
jgi:hypothetical protein